MPNNLKIFFFCFLSISCSSGLPAYSYKAQTDSAYISGDAAESDDLLVMGPKAGLMPIAIDQQHIETPHYAPDVFFNWPGEDTLSVESIRRPIALSPGEHTIRFVMSGTDRRTQKFGEVTFVAVAKEHYKAQQIVHFKHMIGTDFPTSVTFWVEDSKGNKVTEHQTVQMYDASR